MAIFGRRYLCLRRVLSSFAADQKRSTEKEPGWTPSPSWDFAVLDSSEFVVLLPIAALHWQLCRIAVERGQPTRITRRSTELSTTRLPT